MITPFNKVEMITFATLGQLSYGWAAYLSVTYTQLGVPQEDLGVSGGLAGTARYAGGAVASACYSTAIANGIASYAPGAISQAAADNNVPESVVAAASAAAAGGVTALTAIEGVSEAAADAISLAYKYAVAHGLRSVLQTRSTMRANQTILQKRGPCFRGLWCRWHHFKSSLRGHRTEAHKQDRNLLGE